MESNIMIPHQMHLCLLNVSETSALFLIDNVDEAVSSASRPIVMSASPVDETSSQIFFKALRSSVNINCSSEGEMLVEFSVMPNFSISTEDGQETFQFYPQSEDELLFKCSAPTSFELHSIPVMCRELKCQCKLVFETLPVREVSDR